MASRPALGVTTAAAMAAAATAAAQALHGIAFAVVAPGGSRPATLRGSPRSDDVSASLSSGNASSISEGSHMGAVAMAASIGAVVALRRVPQHSRPRSTRRTPECDTEALAFVGSSMPVASGIIDSMPPSPAVARRGQMQPSVPDAGIAIIDKEKVDKKAQMKAEFDKEKWWRVLLHNDDIHTFEYVTGCLTKTCKHLSRRKAYNITWEAHSANMATVSCVWKSLAEQQCVNLQQAGLTVSIAPDSKFDGNKGGQS